MTNPQTTVTGPISEEIEMRSTLTGHLRELHANAKRPPCDNCGAPRWDIFTLCRRCYEAWTERQQRTAPYPGVDADGS